MYKTDMAETKFSIYGYGKHGVLGLDPSSPNIFSGILNLDPIHNTIAKVAYDWQQGVVKLSLMFATGKVFEGHVEVSGALSVQHAIDLAYRKAYDKASGLYGVLN